MKRQRRQERKQISLFDEQLFKVPPKPNIAANKLNSPTLLHYPEKKDNVLTEKELKEIYRTWDEVRSHFIFENDLYMLQSQRTDKTWNGINIYNKSKITANKEDCIYISRKEPILKVYYILLQALVYLYSDDCKHTEPYKSHAQFFATTYFESIKRIIINHFNI